jgi:hypothetical protein
VVGAGHSVTPAGAAHPRGEFRLDGGYVDDVLMARDLTSDDDEGAP